MRLRPGYLVAFNAWAATHPLKSPNAPPDPSYMPQYRVPQQAEAKALNAKADAYFAALLPTQHQRSVRRDRETPPRPR